MRPRCSNEMFGRPPAFCRARSTISGAMSTPTTRASGKRSAINSAADPVPVPTSSAASTGPSTVASAASTGANASGLRIVSQTGASTSNCLRTSGRTSGQSRGKRTATFVANRA